MLQSAGIRIPISSVTMLDMLSQVWKRLVKNAAFFSFFQQLSTNEPEIFGIRIGPSLLFTDYEETYLSEAIRKYVGPQVRITIF